MVSSLASSTAILSQAATAFRAANPNRPTVDQVVEALLQAEKAAKQQQLRFAFEQLQGQWQLCFATGTRKVQQGGIQLKKGYYLPQFAQAKLSFGRDDAGQETIGNQAQLGFLRLQLVGPARYQTKKNLLAFEFTRMQLFVGGKAVFNGAIRGGAAKEQAFAQTAIAKLPFFAFFLITEDFIAARGRGGGLALWIKQANS